MGCGSNISAVAEMNREGGPFRPLKLLQMSAESEGNINHGKMFLFGETRTHRKIIECDFKSNNIKNISMRTRIPLPKIHLDPVQTLYEQSQEIFHLGIYGSCMQPPFNKMLALFMQSNLIFVCGGCDYDHYNVRSEAFYYSIVDEPLKISSQMLHSSQFSQRTLYKPKYSKNKFQKMAGMNEKRYAHTGLYCSKLKSILVFGGVNQDQKMLNTCQMYSVWENAWKQLPSMKMPRAHGHCFLYGNKVYVFGGRSSRHKLTKKIEVLDTQANKWDILNFKLHRGIQEGLAFSINPNEILIVGGRGHFDTYKTAIKVDLKNQSYIWQSELINDYPAIKGLHQNHELFIIGGKKDISEIYFHRRWKEGVFQHKKIIQLEDMEPFSFTKESLIVKESQQQAKVKVFPSQQEIFFGNDVYPCLVLYDRVTGKVNKHPVPLLMRLKSKMEIVQYEKDMFMLMGGCDQTEQKASRSCYFYDKCLGSVRLALKMQFKRFDFATIACDGFVYVFGGYDPIQKQDLVQCQRYNLVTDKWERIADLPIAKSKHKAELLSNNRIVLLGGNSQSTFLKQILIYNPQDDAYEIYTPRENYVGRIKTVNSRQDDNCLYILKQNQTGDYFQSKIELIRQRKDSMVIKKDREKLKEELEVQNINNSPPSKGNQSWKIVKVKSNLQKIYHPEELELERQYPNVKEEEALELHPELVPIKERKQHSQGDEQSSDIHNEKIEEEVQIEPIYFDSHEMMEEIRQSTKYLIQDTARTLKKAKEEEDASSPPKTFEVLQISQYSKQSPKSKNQIKVDENNIEHIRSYILQDKIKDSKLIEWLNNNQHTIIKRQSQTFYLSNNSIFRYEFTELKQQEQEVRVDENILMHTLS